MKEIGIYYKVYKCLCIVLTKLYNKDYGFGSTGYNEIEEFIGIPYLAANKPAHNSKFSEIDITTIMTVFCYFYEGLRFSDIKTIINLYIIPKLTNIKEINNYIYDTLISIIGKRILI